MMKYPLIIKKLWLVPLWRSPKKEIVYRDTKRITYEQFYIRLKKISSGLEKIGIRTGTRIGIIDWNTMEYYEFYFAVPMMGAVLHTINLRLPVDQLIYTINYAEDSFIAIRDEFLPLAEKLAPMLTTVRGWIIFSEEGRRPSTTLKNVYYYEDILNSGSIDYDFPELQEDADALIYFTSGTTGLPKPLKFSHRQLVMQTIINALSNLYPGIVRLESSDVILQLPPLFHGYGWSLPYLATLLGCKMVLPGKLDGKVILDLIKKERITFTAGVPILLRLFLDHPEVDNYREYLKGLKFWIDGEHPPRSLMEKALSYGIQIMEAYGMSEGVGYTFAGLKEHMLDWSLEMKLEYLNKAGLPAPFVEIRVVDEKGRQVPWDGKTIGEVQVRSPGVITEYWNDPRTKESFTPDGWLKTGDVAVIDPEGYLLIIDRAKDVVKSGGEWIPSKALEEIIYAHNAVLDVAVIAAKSNKWGERPIAIIKLKPEYKGKISEEEFRKYLNEFVEKGKIAKWWIPDKFIFIDEMPLTSVGKIDKKVLRDQFKDLILP